MNNDQSGVDRARSLTDEVPAGRSGSWYLFVIGVPVASLVVLAGIVARFISGDTPAHSLGILDFAGDAAVGDRLALGGVLLMLLIPVVRLGFVLASWVRERAWSLVAAGTSVYVIIAIAVVVGIY